MKRQLTNLLKCERLPSVNVIYDYEKLVEIVEFIKEGSLSRDLKINLIIDIVLNHFYDKLTFSERVAFFFFKFKPFEIEYKQSDSFLLWSIKQVFKYGDLKLKLDALASNMYLICSEVK